MKGEDKIFLLQAYYAVSGSAENKKKFEDMRRLTMKLELNV
jgi:hypothetical protein